MTAPWDSKDDIDERETNGQYDEFADTARLHCVDCLVKLKPDDDDRRCAECLADPVGPVLFTDGYDESEAPDHWEAEAHLNEIGGL